MFDVDNPCPEQVEEVARSVDLRQEASEADIKRLFDIDTIEAKELLFILEAFGIIGPALDGKQREVLIHSFGDLDPILEK